MLAVAFATLALLPGFHEARALEPAASFVAGKPAHVYCANSFPAWWSALKSEFGDGVYPDAFTPRNGDASYFSAGDTCALPIAAASGKRIAARGQLAKQILVLVHESIHQRGDTDEGSTECAAIHEMPRVAVKFFHVKPGKQLRDLMAAAWVAHRALPPEYQSVC